MARVAAKAATGTDTVVIALKHPNGIVLEAFEKIEDYEPVVGGGSRKIDKYVTTGVIHALNGNRVPFGTVPSFSIVNGYALTVGVPKHLWETWLEQHKDHPLVVNGLIDAFRSTADAQAFAKNGKSLRSGLEPLLAKGDPRVPKKTDRSGKLVDAMETADEQPPPVLEEAA